MPRQSTRGTGRGSAGDGGSNAAPPAPPGGDEPPAGGSIEPIEIQEEMERSFLEYSMSVIVARALPDVRDGLKPVHRRILYSMFDNGLRPDRPHNKCAKVVGEVMGDYHPHGDSAIYEALARMVQEFSLRYPLIDGHGSFGGRGPDDGAGRHALHGVPAGAARARAHGRHRRRDRRHGRQLRRVGVRAGRAACAVPEPARQRVAGDRRRHGDKRPAPQHGRGDRRRHPRAAPSRGDPRRADGVRQGPRLPDGRADPRSPGHPRRVPDGPRLDQDARRRRDRGRPRRRPHRGDRAAVPDLGGGDRAEDHRPGAGGRARRHQRGAQRVGQPASRSS